MHCNKHQRIFKVTIFFRFFAYLALTLWRTVTNRRKYFKGFKTVHVAKIYWQASTHYTKCFLFHKLLQQQKIYFTCQIPLRIAHAKFPTPGVHSWPQSLKINILLPAGPGLTKLLCSIVDCDREWSLKKTRGISETLAFRNKVNESLLTFYAVVSKCAGPKFEGLRAKLYLWTANFKLVLRRVETPCLTQGHY